MKKIMLVLIIIPLLYQPHKIHAMEEDQLSSIVSKLKNFLGK